MSSWHYSFIGNLLVIKLGSNSQFCLSLPVISANYLDLLSDDFFGFLLQYVPILEQPVLTQIQPYFWLSPLKKKKFTPLTGKQ